MEYEIKAGMLKDGNVIDYRFTIKIRTFEEAVEFLSKVPLTAYDVIKVLPII